MAPHVLAHVTLAVLLLTTVDCFVMQQGPQRPSRALSYKVMGPSPGSDKPTVLEEGTNKIVTGNLNGSSKRFPRPTAQPKETSSSTPPPPTTTGPSMNDLALEWAARNREIDHSLPQPAMTQRRVTAEPAAPTTHQQQPRGASSSRNIGNVAQDWATMNRREPVVKSPPPQPKPVGPSMDDLAQAWMVANQSADTFVDTPPMVAAAPQTTQLPPVASPPPAQPPKGSSSRTGPSMEELALMWVEANRNTDSAFVDTPPMGTSIAMPRSNPQPPIPASRTAATEPMAPPTAGPSMQDLALMWMEANRNTDSYVDTPAIGAGPPAVIDVTPLQEPQTTTFEPATPPIAGPSMEDLALMWMEANRNTDTWVDTPPMGSIVPAVPPVPESPPSLVAVPESSSTGTSFDSLMETIDDSWKDVTNELDEINREAEQTFRALQQMESEMNAMIDKIQAQEASHERKMRQIQDGSFQTEMRLQGQLDSLGKEYEKFRRDAKARHAQAVQSAEEGRALLKGQIDDLKRSLEEKINLAQEESSRAQEYMEKYQETETQLTRVREMHASEMAQTVEKLKPTAERLQDLRRVTETLRNVSQGSQEIMARMRQKLLR